MKYISTRGKTDSLSFQESVMMGLAPDKGLLIPDHIPSVYNHLNEWKNLSFQELALEIISLFADDIPRNDLKSIIDKSYKSFRKEEITPVISVNNLHVLELFHGPTLAFKDLALQFLGNVFSYILDKQGGCLNILGATSGDTGSAAIAGVRNKPNINIFIMHPVGRISPIQEKQMTSVLDENVFNIGIDGTFDDCQYIMKSTFADLEFKNKNSLGAINSVNWARILAQIVYYFYAALSVMKTTGSDKIRFSVPTGNFGNIFAGYIAYKMGLPIEQLILATNENDILTRFFTKGDYSIKEVVPTLSPSMDIQQASNFERYLYFSHTDKEKFFQNDSFFKLGEYRISKKINQKIDNMFTAHRGTSEQTMMLIRKYKEKFNYLLDPHTALGVLAAENNLSYTPTICLATAHPAKFNDTMKKTIGQDIIHPILDAVKDAPTKCKNISNDINAVKDYIVENL